MSEAARRSLALDVFRGIAIAAMILVNTPGSWAHVYAPLLHAEWHGCTPTDLVFPFFLFATGAAMYFSLSRSGHQPSAARLVGVARRAALLVLIGVLLNAYPFTEPLSQWRLPGVLQRIGLAYGLAALLVLYLPCRWRLPAGAVLLAGYWGLLLTFGGADPYGLANNAVRRVDLALLGAAHLWNGFGLAFDPEGLLSTLPAVVSVVAGFEAARLVTVTGGRWRSVLYLALVGAAGVMLALLWQQWLPINKALWTPSYVLYTSGIAWLTLAGLILVLEIAGLRRLGRPLEVYGTNPLLVYILSILLARTLWFIPVGEVSLYTWLYRQLLPLLSPVNASLAFALAHVVLFWLLSLALYRRGIIIKL